MDCNKKDLPFEKLASDYCLGYSRGYSWCESLGAEVSNHSVELALINLD